jgi:hypothetical protein
MGVRIAERDAQIFITSFKEQLRQGCETGCNQPGRGAKFFKHPIPRGVRIEALQVKSERKPERHGCAHVFEMRLFVLIEWRVSWSPRPMPGRKSLKQRESTFITLFLLVIAERRGLEIAHLPQVGHRSEGKLIPWVHNESSARSNKAIMFA